MELVKFHELDHHTAVCQMLALLAQLNYDFRDFNGKRKKFLIVALFRKGWNDKATYIDLGDYGTVSSLPGVAVIITFAIFHICG